MTICADVAVIGGGLAGLYATHLLHRAGADVHLFEARPRLGGRILTWNESGAPDRDGFDLGPSWFWPGIQADMGALVAELGLTAFPQQADGDVLVERTLDGPPQRYTGFRQDPPSMRLVGGTGVMIEALTNTIPTKCLHLGTRIRSLRLSEVGVGISAQDAEGVELELIAAHVIAAVPPRLLAECIEFSPSLTQASLNQWRKTPTWMAPHAKLFAIYDRPFWSDAGLSGTAQSIVGPLTEVHDATTASGKAALFGFVGLDARRRAVVGEDAVKRAAVSQLVRLFGAEAARPRSVLYKDWASDPLTATAADSTSVNHPTGEGNWSDAVWDSRLVLAGSEVSPNFAGYLAGAIDAALHAVARVTALIAARADGRQ